MPKAKTDKLLAEWFWTDRWMGSSAFLLPMLTRGVYREMLTQAWLRGARLPNDPSAIKRAIGATDAEWTEAWPQLSKYWRVDENNQLVNDTQLSIYAESKKSADLNHGRAIKGANARWNRSTGNAQALAQAQHEQCTPSPSLSPSLVSVSGTVSTKKRTAPSALSLSRLPVDNVKIITKLAHEVLRGHNGHKVSGPDLCDEIKTLCATRKIAYDATVIRKALDSAEVQRKVARS